MLPSAFRDVHCPGMSLRHSPRLVATALPPGSDPALWIEAWGGLEGFCLLDSGAGGAGEQWGGPEARWSLAGLGPLDDGAGPGDLEAWRQLVERIEPGGDGVPGPFQGGFLGALAYDLGVHGEELVLPSDPWAGPLVIGGLVTDFAVLDHRTGEGWLVLDEAATDGRPPVEARRAALLDALVSAGSGAGGRGREARGEGPLTRRVSTELHAERVERLRGEIARGEVYQANLAHPLYRETLGHPRDLYLRLRQANPGAYLGYAAWGRHDDGRPDGALLSASPELLLECVGREVRTRPIKGTTARSEDPATDGLRRRALLESEKDLAELAMIVDLSRNDLGRVCEAGGVRVDAFPVLESYRRVHHLVADVRGTLEPGRTGLDAALALFPGGSITGAPKLRAMECIADLEGEGRGMFTGSMGWVDRRGDARLNILIRTLVWRPRPDLGPDRGEVRFHVGGGITWSSDPLAEDRETLDKAAALVEALEGSAELAATGSPEGSPVETP